MLDWLIIGGGIHGTHLSLVLTQQARIPHDRIRVLDPHAEPLTRWHTVTGNTGMSFLRSPLVQHLHYDQKGLGVFARINEQAPYTRFIPTYSRPSLELFNRYSQYLIDKYHLADLRITGSAQELTRIDGGWRVETEAGGIETRRVLLAIGMSDQPFYPDWARELQAAGASVNHVLDPKFSLSHISNGQPVTVIGGGITAAQVAIKLAEQAQVDIFMRHPIRVHDFDSDPCWMNAICLNDFRKIPDMDQRRAVIKAARHRGSLPPDVFQVFSHMVETEILRHHTNEVATAIYSNNQINLHMKDATQHSTHHLLLATGYVQQRPGGRWLQNAIEQYKLPVAACGFPVVDPALCWDRGLYVSGGLAELEIGPAARNIIGARLAGQRLIS